jgi:hypothetical protein
MRYWPPILVTLGASLVLVLVFALLSYLTLSATIGLFTPVPGDDQPSLIVGGGCGLLTLLLLAATSYFIYASFVAARDLRAHPRTLDGVVRLKHTGRGRGGGHWIVIGQEGSPAPDELARSAAPLLTPSTDAAPLGREPAARGFVPGTGESFGAQLQGVRVESRSSDTPLPPELRGKGGGAWRRLAPGELNLRIDKHAFEALAVGDHIQAVYSPHLQHVYYIRKRMEGSTVVLRNTILI